MSLEAFGPNLRRLRLQRGVTIEQIATLTRLPGALFAGLESNNFSRWPTGLYARAYVRQYAVAIGADPDATVDEFCRWFAEGDRRAERLVREHSEIVGHQLTWKDEVPSSAGDKDRRDALASARMPQSVGAILIRLRRAISGA
jgi:transcriptional regulator with XRE-family HTH domain